jgi:hypothetical protein
VLVPYNEIRRFPARRLLDVPPVRPSLRDRLRRRRHGGRDPRAEAATRGVVITGAPAAVSPADSPTFAWRRLDGASAPRCSLDGRRFEPCHTLWRYTDLAEGVHRFRVRVSRGGGIDTAWHIWRIDSVRPMRPSVTGGSREWHNRAVTVTARAADTGSRVAYHVRRLSRDGGATWSRPIRGAVATIWVEGRTLVRFRAVDAAGNRSA